MDGGAWWAAVHGIAKSRTQLSDFTFSFHFHALEKEMATHSSVLAWRVPGTEKPGGLLSMGLRRVWHNWHNLAADHYHLYTEDQSYKSQNMLEWRPANIFCQRIDNTYYRLCKSYELSVPMPLRNKSSHRHYINKWSWQCSHESLFIKMCCQIWPQAIVCPC